jgi:hypothetical protein
METAISDMSLEERTENSERTDQKVPTISISPDYLPVMLGRIARQFNGDGYQIAKQIIFQTVRSSDLRTYYIDMYNNIKHP